DTKALIAPGVPACGLKDRSRHLVGRDVLPREVPGQGAFPYVEVLRCLRLRGVGENCAAVRRPDGQVAADLPQRHGQLSPAGWDVGVEILLRPREWGATPAARCHGGLPPYSYRPALTPAAGRRCRASLCRESAGYRPAFPVSLLATWCASSVERVRRGFDVSRFTWQPPIVRGVV